MSIIPRHIEHSRRRQNVRLTGESLDRANLLPYQDRGDLASISAGDRNLRCPACIDTCCMYIRSLRNTQCASQHKGFIQINRRDEWVGYTQIAGQSDNRLHNFWQPQCYDLAYQMTAFNSHLKPTARFDVSVGLSAGSRIAVVRHSGSDKSTLERLLCGFLICTTQTVPRCGSRAALPRMPRSHT